MSDIRVIPRKSKEDKPGEKLVGIEPDWTLKRWMSVIRAALRSLWSRSPQRMRVLEAAREGDKFRCALCNQLHTSCDVDHIHPAGVLQSFADLSEFAEKLLLVKDEDLRVLCTACHSKRTTEENKARRAKLTN